MPPPLADLDLRTCRATLRGGSRSFFAASLLLPRAVYRPATALYAFCRVADDLIDGGGAPDLALAELRARLDAAYAGRPQPHAADRALAAVVAEHGIPRALLDALLEGFAWDAAGRRYADLAGLEAYAARVAGTVGAMMATIMGERSAAGLARACDLGIAMQLTNIARDVGEDARAGRLYLPTDWLRAAGIDPDGFMAAPRFSPALGRVVAALLDAAGTLYARADSGIATLPRGARPGIAAARHLYAGIGDAVAARGYDSVSARAVTAAGAKLRLIGRSLVAVARGAAPDRSAPVPAARFLVDAVLTAPHPPAPRRPCRGFDERVAWLVALFDELDERQRGRS